MQHRKHLDVLPSNSVDHNVGNIWYRQKARPSDNTGSSRHREDQKPPNGVLNSLDDMLCRGRIILRDVIMNLGKVP